MAAPSYTFARRKDVSCAPLTNYLVTSITATGDATVDICLDSASCASLASASGVSGWAELWSLAGARLVHELWEPFRSLSVVPTGSFADIQSALSGATGLFLANVTHMVAFCDDDGARRLLAIALMTMASTKSLHETMAEDHSKAHSLLMGWVAHIRDKALLPMWLSQEQATKAVLQAHAASSTTHSPHPRSDNTQVPQRVRVESPRRVSHDTPETFKWCSSCASPTHSLLSCFSVVGRIKAAKARGQDTARVLGKIIKDHKAKWTKKGQAFADFYASNPPCSLAQLHAKVAE